MEGKEKDLEVMKDTKDTGPSKQQEHSTYELKETEAAWIWPTQV